jgi:uncharacterized protein YjgD (DUF1641 family)
MLAPSKAEMQLQERLADPRTVQALNKLLEELPETVFLLDMLKSFLKRGPEIAENISDSLEPFRPAPGEVAHTKETLDNAVAAAVKLKEFLNSAQFKALIESDILKPEPVQLVSLLARSLTHSVQNYDAEARLGVVGLLRALNDPDVQRSVNFLVGVLKNFGTELKKV